MSRQTMEVLRRFPLAPLRYTRPLAPVTPPRIREPEPPFFIAIWVYLFVSWSQRVSPPMGPPGPTELGRHSEHAHPPKRAGGNPCVGATSATTTSRGFSKSLR